MASQFQPLTFDCYEVLGLDKSATPKDVKKAYYLLARKYHPDKNRDKEEDNDGASRHFHEITVAYKILDHELRRKIYDDLGRSAFSDDGKLHLLSPFLFDTLEQPTYEEDPAPTVCGQEEPTIEPTKVVADGDHPTLSEHQPTQDEPVDSSNWVNAQPDTGVTSVMQPSNLWHIVRKFMCMGPPSVNETYDKTDKKPPVKHKNVT